jgi:LytS/YehU family sensor histidine kinase
VETVRFKEDLDVGIEASAAARRCPVPILILQPLIDNAIKYGMETTAKPLRLRVRASVEGERLRLEVANTGRWVDLGTGHSRRQTRVGLENLRKRLELLYPGRHTFEMTATDDWVIGTIDLPAEYAEERRS